MQQQQQRAAPMNLTIATVPEPVGRSTRSNANSKMPAPAAAAPASKPKPQKVVRINSIDNPISQLRDLHASDAAEGATRRSSEHRSATFDQLALLYAMGLTLFGFVFPLSNYVSVTPFSAWYLAGFYILLYLVSIAFLVFFLTWVLRRKPHILFLPDSERQGKLMQHHLHHRPGPVTFQVGMNDSTMSNDEETGLENDAFNLNNVTVTSAESSAVPTLPATPASGIECIELHEPGAGDDPDLPDSRLLQNAREFGVQEIPAFSVLSLQESHSPSFFLRVACFLFGALKMTHEMLMIVDSLTDICGNCADKLPSESVAQVLQYTLSIVFTVLQTFFLFKYSKVSVNFYRNLSVMGFMHLLATNMCVWFQAILLETSHSTKSHAYDSNYSSSYSSAYSNKTTVALTSATTSKYCSKDVFWRMAPYLFPFTIEYALMAAFTSFTLYRNVSKFLDVIQSKGFNVAKKCLKNRKRSQTSFSASCYKTDRGFLLGALLLILGIVSGIYFTVYISEKPNDATTSQLIYQITDLVLLIVNLILCAIAYAKIRQLTLLHRASTGPDSWLLGITLIGVLAYQLFQLFGAAADEGLFLALRVLHGLLSIGQSVFQVFLVLDGEKRRSKSAEAIEKKPGREMIAALLLGNIAQWIVYTLEIREINNMPNYSHAYVPVASNIVAYVCSPLIIFFRFHSSCCFVEIWRTAYKGRKRTRCHSHPDLAVCSTVPGSVSALPESSTKTHL